MKYLLAFVALFSSVEATTPRNISPSTVAEVRESISSGPAIFIMRHGEQQESTWVAELTDPALKKIAMMRKVENLQNPITEDSKLELKETVQAFRTIIEHSGIESWHIETSKNMRAFQAAKLLSDELKLPIFVKEQWSCINYPDESAMSNEELLEILPNETLPWNEETVDAIAGNGTYKRIHHDVKKAVKSYEPKHGVIIITHTHQMNAAAEQNGLPVIRVNNYGFVLITDKESRHYESGFYQEK